MNLKSFNKVGSRIKDVNIYFLKNKREIGCKSKNER